MGSSLPSGDSALPRGVVFSHRFVGPCRCRERGGGREGRRCRGGARRGRPGLAGAEGGAAAVGRCGGTAALAWGCGSAGAAGAAGFSRCVFPGAAGDRFVPAVPSAAEQVGKGGLGWWVDAESWWCG